MGPQPNWDGRIEAIDAAWRMTGLKGIVLEIGDWGLKINYFKWENDFSFKSSSPLKDVKYYLGYI